MNAGRWRGGGVAAIVAIISWFILGPVTAASARSLKMLHADGTNIYDSGSHVVHFTGSNIGSWLVTENWMCPIDSSGHYPDMYSVIQELDSRFGVATEQSMIRNYQSDWITTSDLQNIKNRGDNCVRVPVWWGDFYPLSALGATSPSLRPDAFDRLDWIVKQCSSVGLYVVIDMHGVFGGQSKSQDCGQQNSNAYWSDANDQGNTALLWWEIAHHYKGNGTVAGYDLINEPMGAPSPSAVWTVYDSLYKTIRSADPKHMIFLEGTFDKWDWSMLPNPSTYGWTNVVYEMHEYQNGKNTARVEAGAQKQVDDFGSHKDWNVPCYIGEFNCMGNGIDCWNYCISLYNTAGINWSMWSYKCSGVTPDSWGWYDPTNKATTPNIETDPETTILADWALWTSTPSFVANPTVL